MAKVRNVVQKKYRGRGASSRGFVPRIEFFCGRCNTGVSTNTWYQARYKYNTKQIADHTNWYRTWLLVLLYGVYTRHIYISSLTIKYVLYSVDRILLIVNNTPYLSHHILRSIACVVDRRTCYNHTGVILYLLTIISFLTINTRFPPSIRVIVYVHRMAM